MGETSSETRAASPGVAVSWSGALKIALSWGSCGIFLEASKAWHVALRCVPNLLAICGLVSMKLLLFHFLFLYLSNG